MTNVRDHARAIDALTPTLARAIRGWMGRFVARELREVARDPHAYVRVTKALGDDEDLRRLLLRFGARRAVSTARRAAREGARATGQRVDPEAVIPGSIERDVVENKPTKIVAFQRWLDGVESDVGRISAEARETIRSSVRETIAASLAEPVTPSVGEIARRINRTIVAVEPAEDPSKDRVYVFTHARAETIARTELVQVENTARIAGYEETGVEAIEWVAYNDGRSGDRHHERMDGRRVALGELFTTPRGNRLRYPGDPLGPIEETANCRCTTKPALLRRRGRR